ncbi:DUF6406 domain-containing protein [Streptomyces sp. NPDC002324]
MIDQLALRSGVPRQTEDAWFAVRHLYAPVGRPTRVYLIVATDEEREFELGVGDTFPVRDQTWTFERIEKPATGDDQYVVLRKVEPAPTAD